MRWSRARSRVLICALPHMDVRFGGPEEWIYVNILLSQIFDEVRQQADFGDAVRVDVEGPLSNDMLAERNSQRSRERVYNA